MSNDDPSKVDLFEWLHSVNLSKTDLMTEINERSFDPFMITRAVAMSPDTVEYAFRATTKLSKMPREVVYRYYLHAIPKKKRYGKWPKKPKKEDEREKQIEVLKQFYQVGRPTAIEYLRLLRPSQVQDIEDRMNQGGVQK